MDGTGRITLRNCAALRRMVPFNSIINDDTQMEHPNTLDVPGEAATTGVGVPLVPQETVFDVPGEAAPTVEAEELNGPPDDPTIVVRRSSRICKVPNRLGFT